MIFGGTGKKIYFLVLNNRVQSVDCVGLNHEKHVEEKELRR
jgi:hypothetical protein